MQDAHSVQLAALRLQRLAHIHGVLGGLVSLAGMVEQVARALRALVEDAEDKLRVVGGGWSCMEVEQRRALGFPGRTTSAGARDAQAADGFARARAVVTGRD